MECVSCVFECDLVMFGMHWVCGRFVLTRSSQYTGVLTTLIIKGLRPLTAKCAAGLVDLCMLGGCLRTKGGIFSTFEMSFSYYNQPVLHLHIRDT